MEKSSKHSVQISEKLYQDLKEYSSANGIKLGEYIENLIKKSFALERYGDVPFGVYKEEPVIGVVVEDSLRETDIPESTLEKIPERNKVEEDIKILEKAPVKEGVKEQVKEQEISVKPKKKVTKLN